MKTSRLRTIVATGLLGLALGPSPAAARAAITNAFVATARATIELLETSDALALDRSASARLRAFARRDTAVQMSARDMLAAWAHADAVAADAAAHAPSIDHLGPVFGLLNADLQPILRAPATAAERQDLGRLEARTGSDFDGFYVPTEQAALDRLVALYKDYILNGDDETLRALAVHALPKVEHLRAALPRW